MKKEKIYNLLLFILIFLSILSTIILNPLNNLDEIWNYNFARNISNGLIPYKEFNIIITPLLSIICGLILKITVDELIVMRIIAAILCSSILYITYKIFNLVNIKKEYAIIFTFFIGYLFKDIFCIDYNYGNLLIALLLIYQEIKNYQKEEKIITVDIKQDIFIGILAGLSITIKHTIGIFICLVALANKALFIKNKEELKSYIKSFCYRIIGIFIPIILLILYLILNQTFGDFINYTIKGISEFTNIISYSNLIRLNLIGILSILVPITLIYAWVKTVILEKNKKIYLIMVYGTATFAVCFPISDKIHFLIGSLPTIIIIFYELYNMFKKLLKSNKSIKIMGFITLTIYYIIIFFLIYYSILNLYNYFLKINSCSDLKHFKYIPISQELETQIKIVENYINTNKGDVKILDSAAAIYMIPIDRYNKDYDMFNKGNFGINGEQRIIKEIENSENTIYLILKEDYTKNWQTPLKIIEYVKQNKRKIDTIEIFDIYK